MPTFEFELPQEDFDYLKELGEDLGVTPSQMLHVLIDWKKMRLENEKLATLAEASMAGAGESVPVNEAFWADVDRRIEKYVAEANRNRAKASA